MSHVDTAIVAVKTVTVLLGGLITFLSYKAYRRTGSRSLQRLAVGFAIITVGSVLAGSIDLFVGVDIRESVLLESAITALGFGFITYSLFSS